MLEVFLGFISFRSSRVSPIGSFFFFSFFCGPSFRFAPCATFFFLTLDFSSSLLLLASLFSQVFRSGFLVENRHGYVYVIPFFFS